MKTIAQNHKKYHWSSIGLISLLLCTMGLNAQTIEKFSIDSGGAIASASGIQILYTIGEVNIQEVSVGTLQLSEGFINPNLFTTLSIATAETLNMFKVFPNPVSDMLVINYHKPIDRVEIYDTVGKQVMTVNNTDKVNFESLQTGTYFLKIASGTSVFNAKIIKMD